jgi:hypothetical protein
MPRTLADKRERWVILTTAPTDPEAVSAVEAEAGIRAECALLASETRLSPTASDTINEQSFCESANAPTPTNGNAEGNLAVFRFLDPDTGLPVTLEDAIFSALIPKGTEVHILKSKGPLHTAEFVDGHPYDLYRVITDNKQDPTQRGGYIKDMVPLLVQDFWLNRTIGGDPS